MCEAGVGRESRLEGRCLDVVGKEPKRAYPYTPHSDQRWSSGYGGALPVARVSRKSREVSGSWNFPNVRTHSLRTELHLAQIQKGKPSGMLPCHVLGPFPYAASTGFQVGGGGERRDNSRSGSSRNDAAGAAEIRGRCQQVVPSEVGPTGQLLAGTTPLPPTYSTGHSGGQAGTGAPCCSPDHPTLGRTCLLVAPEMLGEDVLGILWGFMRDDGYNSLLIPSWARKGRDCLLSSRLMLSDKILQAKIWGYGNVCPLSSISPVG